MERETDFRVTMIGEKNFPWFERFLNEKPSGEQAGLGLIMDDRACGASFLLRSAMDAMRDYQVSEMMVCYSPDEGLEAFLAKMGFVCAPSLTLRSFKATDLIDSPECRKSIARLKMEGVIPFASLSRKLTAKNSGERSLMWPGRRERSSFR